MRILYFHQHFSTPSGATGTRSYEMAQKLIQRGHEVSMVCGSYNVGKTGLTAPFEKGMREGVVNGINVVEFELTYANTDSFVTRSKQFLKFAWQSIKVAMSRDYDLLFATSTPLTAAIPGIIAKVFRRKPFVFEVRDLWPELPKAMGVITNPLILGGMSVLEKLAYVVSNRCIGLSPGIVEGIKKRSRKTALIEMVPNGCDISLFENPDGQVPLPFERSQDDLVCVFTGAHGIANGLDAVLDAAAILKQSKNQMVKLLFVGEGAAKEGLKKRSEREELDNCYFMDAIPKTQLVNLLHQADVGIMPLANVPAFYYGTSPNKFFDYISCALPVVNNYPGWLADMINTHECGVAVPPENANALADALVKLQEDKSVLEGMGKNGLSLAKDAFNRDMLSDKFATFLEEVAND